MGNLPQCLQKGIGIGKRQRAEKGPPRFMLFVSVILPILIFVILAVGLFSYLYFGKPSIVTTHGSDNRKRIDWGKFMTFYIPTVTLMGFQLLIIILVRN